MSVTQPRHEPPERVFISADSGPSWVVFSATMIGLIATMTFIYGVAAVGRSSFFVGEAEYVIADLRTWGWVLIGVSVIQGATSIAVIARMTGARWVGVGVVAVHATVQLLAFPAYPWWAGILFTLDVLVIYGLIAHGSD
jgi:hypothetical protein